MFLMMLMASSIAMAGTPSGDHAGKPSSSVEAKDPHQYVNAEGRNISGMPSMETLRRQLESLKCE